MLNTGAKNSSEEESEEKILQDACINLAKQVRELSAERLDLLGLKILERTAAMHNQFSRTKRLEVKSRHYEKTGVMNVRVEETDIQQTAGEEKPKRRKPNDISHITEDRIEEIRDELFFSYQRKWHDHKHHRNRFILKSRQIGATFYFAWEAFTDAILTRDNQIFLSSSRDQALVFRDYIVDLAQRYFDVEIKGQHLVKLSNGAKLRFLATNSATAQSFNGHLYRDEVFWMANYKKMKKVTSGMAAHKKWRITDMSSPSAMSHEAYDIWCGAEYARNNKISDLDIDTSHATLKEGALGVDGVWRHMITVEDAQAQGCDLFDIDSLKRENSKNDFDNLYMCKFIDDSQSVFSLQELMDNCIVDADDWPDYKPQMERPYANRAVAFGYDPSRTSDNASLAILKMPANYSDSFRVLALHSFHGQNVQRQAGQMKELVDKHTVRHLGVDTTGIGSGVYDLILDFYPQATGIHYSPQMKTQLVVKMLDLVANGRIKYLATQHEITRAFMMVNQTTTSSGQIVYASSRSPNAGHADIFWAIAHACAAEEINVNRRPTTVTFSD